MDENPNPTAVDEFIVNEIDSVPHLEALLLIWNSRPQEWTFEAMSSALYLPLDGTRLVIADLERRGFATLTAGGRFLYRSSDHDRLIEQVDKTSTAGRTHLQHDSLQTRVLAP